ncbi:SDR family oxidoreductase [Aquimarina sp. W85]|uniref:SDR family oxidoreductase n=1 Tax=Aquimarina rhodophyticola TaxID=3342246 RepID=UPI003672FDEB
MERILIAGANGTTGKQIVNYLKVSDNFVPVAMVRKEEQVKEFESQGIETVFGDLEKDLSNVTKGIDKVIFAAGSGGEKVIEVDQEGAKKLIDVSKKSGIKKFVMLSSMGADAPEKANELQEYLKAKHNADVYLRESGLNYTIVRPGSLNNEQGNGNIILNAHLDKSGEIPRSDVAKTLINSLEDDRANNTTFEILEGDTPIAEAVVHANE